MSTPARDELPVVLEAAEEAPTANGAATKAQPGPPVLRGGHRERRMPWLERLRHRLRWLLGVRIGVLRHHAPRPLHVPRRYHDRIEIYDPPVVSLVTPSYDQGDFLERTLTSVLDQAYPRLEYVVQDGGSTDGSVDILDRYRPRLTHAESCRDRGQAHAINVGFARTRGEIMAYLNADDLLLPGSLSYVAHYFRHHPEVDVVYGHRILIDENGAEVGRWVLPPHDNHILAWADYVPQETLFWRRRLWDRVGGSIDETFRFAIDWDLLLRFRDVRARMVRLPRFLGAFRVHPRSKTVTLPDVCMQEMFRLRDRCHRRRVHPREIHRNIFGYLLRQAGTHRLYQFGLLRY